MFLHDNNVASNLLYQPLLSRTPPHALSLPCPTQTSTTPVRAPPSSPVFPAHPPPGGLPQQSWVADPRYQHQLFPAPPPPPRAPPYSYSLDTRTRNYYPAASPRTHAAPFPPLFPPTDWTSPAEHPRHDHTRHDHHAPYPQPPYPFADPHDRDPWPSELASPASDRAPDEPLVKKKRKRADANQLRVLNATYQRTAFPSTQERESLAKELDMSPRSVQIWCVPVPLSASPAADSEQVPEQTAEHASESQRCLYLHRKPHHAFRARRLAWAARRGVL